MGFLGVLIELFGLIRTDGASKGRGGVGTGARPGAEGSYTEGLGVSLSWIAGDLEALSG